MKYYVCLRNKWNPYSNEVEQLPVHYWVTMYGMLTQESIMNWKEKMEPHAELVGQLCKPEIFKQYISMKKQLEEKKKKGEPLEASYQDG